MKKPKILPAVFDVPVAEKTGLNQGYLLLSVRLF